MVVEITPQNFEQEVLKSEIPVVLDFYTNWCGPCRMMIPILENLSVSLKDKAKFCKVNVEKYNEIAAEYGVSAIPVIAFFRDGKIMQKLVGAQPEVRIQECVNLITKA